MITMARTHTRTVAPSLTGFGRQSRWHQYGWASSPVKAGLWPPPSAAVGLDRSCCPAFVRHHGFDGRIRHTI